MWFDLSRFAWLRRQCGLRGFLAMRFNVRTPGEDFFRRAWLSAKFSGDNLRRTAPYSIAVAWILYPRYSTAKGNISEQGWICDYRVLESTQYVYNFGRGVRAWRHQSCSPYWSACVTRGGTGDISLSCNVSCGPCISNMDMSDLLLAVSPHSWAVFLSLIDPSA